MEHEEYIYRKYLSDKCLTKMVYYYIKRFMYIYVYMDYLEKRVTIRLPVDLYESIVSVGKVSDVVRDSVSYYFAKVLAKQHNEPVEIKNESVWKIEDGDKPQKRYIKNASYYQKLKQYKEITNTPWDTFYVLDAWDLPRHIVLQTLGLSEDIFDPNDL